MTVSPDQIAKAKAAGLDNVDIAAQVANEVGIKWYHLCALMEKESMGRHVFGHDVGGALSGFSKTVDKSNYEVFRWLVFTKGQTSNGVGVMQITSKGLLLDMESKNLRPYDIHDNIHFGATLWLSYYKAQRAAGFSRDDAIRRAGKQYNGSATYGERLLAIMNKWIGIVGSSDYN